MIATTTTIARKDFDVSSEKEMILLHRDAPAWAPNKKRITATLPQQAMMVPGMAASRNAKGIATKTAIAKPEWCAGKGNETTRLLQAVPTHLPRPERTTVSAPTMFRLVLRSLREKNLPRPEAMS
jgi:hypothetical protein